MISFNFSDIYIYLIGFAAQLSFSARLIVQLIKSEKVKKVLTPVLFWELSLLASFLLFIYGFLRDDFAIMLGQSITYFIYIRNMQLQGTWSKIPKGIKVFFYIFPLIIILYFFNNNQIDSYNLFNNNNISTNLLIWGIIGQVIFTFRFVYQWFYSEKNKESLLPLGFWILSIIGSTIILIYAILRKDPVLFIGQSFGFYVYVRNIILEINSKK